MDEKKRILFVEKLRKAKEMAFQRREEEKKNKKENKIRERLSTKSKDLDISIMLPNTSLPIMNITKDQETKIEVINGEINLNEETKEEAISNNNGTKRIGNVLPNKKTAVKIKVRLGAGKILSKDKKQSKTKSTDRSRKHRANLSEEQREIIRQKDRERKRKLREAKIIKPIADMSEREKRNQRKKWRVSKKASREKQKHLETVISQTPPNSDDESRHINNRGSASRKKKKLTRTKMYRELQASKKVIMKLKSDKEKYKKRWQRSKNSKKDATSQSPNTKVTNLISKRVIPADIKKQLLVGETLQSQILENLEQEGKSYKRRQCYKKILSGPLYKKYRIQSVVVPLISHKQNKKWQNNKKDILKYQRKTGQPVLSKLGTKKITMFFQRDDISRMYPGKKEFKRKGTLRKQKRLLMYSLKECYKRFSQNSAYKISYTSFIKAKPFWVVFPTNSDRETCLCVKHENFSLICNKLKALKMTDELKVSEILKQEKIEVRMEDWKQKTGYYQWQSRTEERIINDTKRKIRITSKILIETTIKDMAITFFEQLPIMKKHSENITHQFKELRNLKANLSTNAVILQVDFSENYYCKLHTEIQSMHFGANKRQLSIHTGVMYFIHNNKLATKSFATISENLDHQCHGVWGHLTPILQDFANQNPHIDTVHFFSDVPTSQYKNRFNICLLVTILPDIFKNLKYTTWNYSEAGHGKGPMDGVGGSLKRQADNFVLRGGDILNASDFVMIFIDSKINVSLVDGNDIKQIKNSEVLLGNVPQIPNITKLHQIAWHNNTNYLFLRELSCFNCEEKCIHFSSGNGKVNFNISGKAEPVAAKHNDEPSIEPSTKIGDWVAVVYGNNWFPGLVQNSVDGQLTVKFMSRSGNNTFYWPNILDVQQVSCKDILCKLPFEPQQLSSMRPNIFHIVNFKDVNDLLDY